MQTVNYQFLPMRGEGAICRAVGRAGATPSGAAKPGPTQDWGVMRAWVACIENGRPTYFAPLDENGMCLTVWLKPSSFAKWIMFSQVPVYTVKQCTFLRDNLPLDVYGHLLLQSVMHGFFAEPMSFKMHIAGVLCLLGEDPNAIKFIDGMQMNDKRKEFNDVCVVDALRSATGVDIPYQKDGPFSFDDANEWLKHIGLMLGRRVRLRDGRNAVAPGDYLLIFHFHCTHVKVIDESAIWYNGNVCVQLSLDLVQRIFDMPTCGVVALGAWRDVWYI